MLYLSGQVHRSLLDVPHLGFMVTPRSRSLVPEGYTIWAADTGCFKHPESFELSRYLGWLLRRDRRRCLFASAPDRVGDWRATMELAWEPMLRIREIGYRAAFVAQDGLEPENAPWEELDWLFIGGTEDWKESRHAERLVRAAKRRGKCVHMGRVNSMRRVQIAKDFGCDTVDGNLLRYGRDKNLNRIEWWMKIANDQGYLYEQSNLSAVRGN